MKIWYEQLHISQHKISFDWEGGRPRSSIVWSGNDQEEIDLRSNTTYTMLLKTWRNCRFTSTKRKAGILHNILDMFRGLWPLCDYLLMPNGAEENPDFTLHSLQWPKHMKCPNKTKPPTIHAFLKLPNEKENEAQRSNEEMWILQFPK